MTRISAADDDAELTATILDRIGGPGHDLRDDPGATLVVVAESGAGSGAGPVSYTHLTLPTTPYV